MKRAFFLLLPAVLLVLIALVGCNDETNPKFTRIRVYPACGVMPLSVDALAMVSGGNESGDPTGGNNNLEITWDFGDGGGGNTSISYHTFADSGLYTVTATAVDPDGKTTSISQIVQVMPDTLTIEASSNFAPGPATVNDTVRFELMASSCEIQSLVDDDYRNLIFNWDMNDGTGNQFQTRRPQYQFLSAGTFEVTVTVTFPELAVTRRDTLQLVITDP